VSFILLEKLESHSDKLHSMLAFAESFNQAIAAAAICIALDLKVPLLMKLTGSLPCAIAQ